MFKFVKFVLFLFYLLALLRVDKSIIQSASKHGPFTFLYSAMRKLVGIGQPWSIASSLGNFEVVRSFIIYLEQACLIDHQSQLWIQKAIDRLVTSHVRNVS